MGAHGLGKETALLGERGGAAGTAVDADEEEAFGKTGANWEDMGKWRGGKTKTTCQNVLLSEKKSEDFARSHALEHQ